MARRATGTVGHPYSALNLRLALALFGVVSMLLVAGVALAYGSVPIAVVALVVAVAAMVNAVVVQRRRRQRRRTDPQEHHSLFE